MMQDSLTLIYSKKSADLSDMCNSALMCLVKNEMKSDFVLLIEKLQIEMIYSLLKKLNPNPSLLVSSCDK